MVHDIEVGQRLERRTFGKPRLLVHRERQLLRSDNSRHLFRRLTGAVAPDDDERLGLETRPQLLHARLDLTAFLEIGAPALNQDDLAFQSLFRQLGTGIVVCLVKVRPQAGVEEKRAQKPDSGKNERFHDATEYITL